MIRAFQPILLLLLLAACAATPPTAPPSPTAGSEMTEMEGMTEEMEMTSSEALAPLVQGFYDGETLQFIHTEASDPAVAEMLTDMMGGAEVVLVPALADAPPALLANLYVFTNGIAGQGPFGFQPDVFDAVPGDDGYRPLRAVNLVAWQASATPRELRSVAEVQGAAASSELTIEAAGIVVNMPILTWPGGSR